ncbi:hypothetical protein AHAS_Ahas03G0166800 [Arachis hypogaea]
MESEISDDVSIVGMEFESIDDRAESKVDETRKVYPKGPTGCKARMIASSNVSDVRNFIDLDTRSIGKGGDGKVVMDYFELMKERDNHFYYDVDYDEECQIIRIFFDDPRSIASYEYFRDVVSFDTTCTDKYDMSFAAFVRVNPHGQFVLVVCGLLNSEDEASFVWLFNSSVNCMSEQPPATIVTN